MNQSYASHLIATTQLCSVRLCSKGACRGQLTCRRLAVLESTRRRSRMHWRCARRLRRVMVVVLLLLGRILSRKLLRIIALLLHWHRCIASLVSSRYAQRIDSSAGRMILSLRRLAGSRGVIARITVAGEEESGQADETQGRNASNCASRNGTHGSAAVPAARIGSGCGQRTRGLGRCGCSCRRRGTKAVCCQPGWIDGQESALTGLQGASENGVQFNGLVGRGGRGNDPSVTSWEG